MLNTMNATTILLGLGRDLSPSFPTEIVGSTVPVMVNAVSKNEKVSKQAANLSGLLFSNTQAEAEA